MKIKDRLLLCLILLAILLFSPMFLLREVGPLDFWWWMSANLVILITLAWWKDLNYRRHLRDDLSKKLTHKLLLGVFSAALLYGVFYAGNIISPWILPQAPDQISSIYDFKGDASRVRILLLMLLIIGPGEELFWRGYLQRKLMLRTGNLQGFIWATLLYTLVHILTGNVMLILAAATAGIFWGWMYMKYRSVTANMISHLLWDISIFLIWPIQ